MRPSEVPPPGGVTILTDADAPDFIERHGLAVLAFVAGDDPACAKLLPRLALVAAKTGVPMGTEDVDAHRLVAEALGVKSVPMLLLFERGVVVDRLIGAPPEVVIEDVVRARTGRGG